MILYAESSAVLAWLFGEGPGKDVVGALRAASEVIASDLTLVECDRVIHRAVATGGITEVEGLERRADLNRASAHWDVLHLDGPVIERARGTFPVEPVRTLDALHLAAALRLRGTVPDLELLTLDERVRMNARALGLAVRPVPK
jgi:predicted nucleic acid-binding protein